MRRWIWLPIGIVSAAVVVSMTRAHPPTVGEKILSAMEHSSGTARSALLILDYTPDETAIAQTMRETIDRGTGIPPGFGLDSLDTNGKKWIKTTDALLFWSPPQGPTTLRNAIENAHQQLVLYFAHGPFDDSETDAAFKSALAQLTTVTDEILFLDWANADRGVLAALDDRPSALRQALLLLASPNNGPILAFDCSGQHIYLIPASATADLTWCEIQAYEPNGPMAWSGMLRLNGHPSAERVRTLAVALVRQAANPPAAPQTSPNPLILHF